MNNILSSFDKIINNNLDINKINTEFNENARVSIKNILNDEFAQHLYNYLNKLPNSLWHTACVYSNTKYMKPNIEKYKNKNKDFINKANISFSIGEFSYSLNRTMNSENSMNYTEFILRKTLNSEEFISLLNSCLGMELTKLNDLFISLYKPLNFLSPHCDVQNGIIAVTISLTKDWKPQYGGNLCFLSEDRTKIIDTIVPSFNSLYAFYIPTNTGIPHFVSHVAPRVIPKRFTITMWYS